MRDDLFDSLVEYSELVERFNGIVRVKDAEVEYVTKQS